MFQHLTVISIALTIFSYEIYDVAAARYVPKWKKQV